MPDVLKMKFTYSETVTLTCTLGAQNNYNLRGNSPFDPNQSGAGAQPPGFDQMAPFYQHYSCYYSAVEVDFITTATNPVYLVIAPNVGAAASNLTYDTAFSLSRAKRAIMPNLQNGGKWKMRNACSTKNANGNSVDDKDNHGAFTGNPGQQWYWIICCQPSDQTTQTLAISFAITYYCVLFGRLPVNNS